VYGSETWAIKVNDMRILERAENAMFRWTCGVKFKDRARSAELMNTLGIGCVERSFSG